MFQNSDYESEKISASHPVESSKVEYSQSIPTTNTISNILDIAKHEITNHGMHSENSFQYDEVLRLYSECVQLLMENKQLAVKGEGMREILCAQRKIIRRISSVNDWMTQNRVMDHNKNDAASIMRGINSSHEHPEHDASKKTQGTLMHQDIKQQGQKYFNQITQKTSQEVKPTHLSNQVVSAMTDNISMQWIKEITQEEFETIPRYVKNRSTLDQLNEFVALVNHCLKERYTAIAHNWRIKEIDEQLESRASEGHYWLSDKSLIETGKWKSGMHGKSLLGCLRFLKKAKIEKTSEFTKIIILEVLKPK